MAKRLLNGGSYLSKKSLVSPKHRYAETARSFERETNLDLKKYDVCDNIDLGTVLQEYESYYYVRFNKYPKITKKLSNTNLSTKIAKTSSSVGKKSAYGNSTVPSLPNVHANSNGSSGPGPFTRPMSVENSHHPKGAHAHHGSNPGNVFTLNPNHGNASSASGLNGAATTTTTNFKTANSNELKSHSVSQNQFQGADKKNKGDRAVSIQAENFVCSRNCKSNPFMPSASTQARKQETVLPTTAWTRARTLVYR